MNSRFDYTILDAISNALKTVKASPLVLGATSVGSGGPIGGFVGYLTQRRVSYDVDELATDNIPESGLSLVDNLNHIRYRLGYIESGYSPSFIGLDDVPSTYSGSAGKAVIVNLTENGLEFGVSAGSIDIQENGITVLSGVETIDFAGGVILSSSGSTVVVTVSGGSLPGFDPNRVLTTDSYGNAGTTDGMQFDQATNALTVGGTPEVAVTDNSFNQISDGISAAHFLYTWGDGLASYITGFFTGGTKASPIAAVINSVMLRLRGRAYDGSYSVNTSAEIDLVADEDHSTGNHGARVEIYTTPNGSSTMVKALTVGSDGNVNIEASKTYNIDGIPHTHDFTPLDIDYLHAEIG